MIKVGDNIKEIISSDISNEHKKIEENKQKIVMDNLFELNENNEEPSLLFCNENSEFLFDEENKITKNSEFIFRKDDMKFEEFNSIVQNDFDVNMLKLNENEKEVDGKEKENLVIEKDNKTECVPLNISMSLPVQVNKQNDKQRKMLDNDKSLICDLSKGGGIFIKNKQGSKDTKEKDLSKIKRNKISNKNKLEKSINHINENTNIHQNYEKNDYLTLEKGNKSNESYPSDFIRNNNSNLFNDNKFLGVKKFREEKNERELKRKELSNKEINDFKEKEFFNNFDLRKTKETKEENTSQEFPKDYINNYRNYFITSTNTNINKNAEKDKDINIIESNTQRKKSQNFNKIENTNNLSNIRSKSQNSKSYYSNSKDKKEQSNDYYEGKSLNNSFSNNSNKSNIQISNLNSNFNNQSEKNSDLNIQNLKRNLKNKKFNKGRWSEKEHKRFIEAIIKFGNRWKKVQQIIITRSSSQARSHAQKFFLRIKKDFKINSNISFESFSLFTKFQDKFFNMNPNIQNKTNLLPHKNLNVNDNSNYLKNNNKTTNENFMENNNINNLNNIYNLNNINKGILNIFEEKEKDEDNFEKIFNSNFKVNKTFNEPFTYSNDLEFAEFSTDKNLEENFPGFKSFNYKGNLTKMNDTNNLELDALNNSYENKLEKTKEIFLDYLYNLNKNDINVSFTKEMKDLILKEFIVINEDKQINENEVEINDNDYEYDNENDNDIEINENELFNNNDKENFKAKGNFIESNGNSQDFSKENMNENNYDMYFNEKDIGNSNINPNDDEFNFTNNFNFIHNHIISPMENNSYSNEFSNFNMNNTSNNMNFSNIGTNNLNNNNFNLSLNSQNQKMLKKKYLKKNIFLNNLSNSKQIKQEKAKINANAIKLNNQSQGQMQNHMQTNKAKIPEKTNKYTSQSEYNNPNINLNKTNLKKFEENCLNNFFFEKNEINNINNFNNININNINNINLNPSNKMISNLFKEDNSPMFAEHINKNNYNFNTNGFDIMESEGKDKIKNLTDEINKKENIRKLSNYFKERKNSEKICRKYSPDENKINININIEIPQKISNKKIFCIRKNSDMENEEKKKDLGLGLGQRPIKTEENKNKINVNTNTNNANINTNINTNANSINNIDININYNEKISKKNSVGNKFENPKDIFTNDLNTNSSNSNINEFNKDKENKEILSVNNTNNLNQMNRNQTIINKDLNNSINYSNSNNTYSMLSENSKYSCITTQINTNNNTKVSSYKINANANVNASFNPSSNYMGVDNNYHKRLNESKSKENFNVNFYNSENSNKYCIKENNRFFNSGNCHCNCTCKNPNELNSGNNSNEIKSEYEGLYARDNYTYENPQKKVRFKGLRRLSANETNNTNYLDLRNNNSTDIFYKDYNLNLNEEDKEKEIENHNKSNKEKGNSNKEKERTNLKKNSLYDDLKFFFVKEKTEPEISNNELKKSVSFSIKEDINVKLNTKYRKPIFILSNKKNSFDKGKEKDISKLNNNIISNLPKKNSINSNGEVNVNVISEKTNRKNSSTVNKEELTELDKFFSDRKSSDFYSNIRYNNYCKYKRKENECLKGIIKVK